MTAPAGITLTQPDDWHLHLRDPPPWRASRPHGGALCPGDRHAEPQAPGDDYGAGPRLPRPYPGRIGAGASIRAADDPVPDRPPAAGRDRPCPGQRPGPCRQTLPGGGHDQFRGRGDRPGRRLPGPGAHAAPGSCRCWCTGNPPTRRWTSSTESGASSTSASPGSCGISPGCASSSSTSPPSTRWTSCWPARRPWPPPSPLITCSTIVGSCSPGEYARTSTVCRSSSARPIVRPWCRRPPAATRASFWAPTVRRTPRAPRRRPAAARGSTALTPASSSMRRPSSRRGAGSPGGVCKPIWRGFLSAAAQPG